MDFVRGLIKQRLVNLNATEKKLNIEDVLFTVQYSSGEIKDISIYLLPYENLSRLSDKPIARDTLLTQITNKQFFKEKSIGIENFNYAVFFSFDTIQSIDYCFIINFENYTQNTKAYDLEGNFLLNKEVQLKTEAPSKSQTQNSTDPYYLFFDTETNGLPLNWKAPITNLSNWPRLVQLAFSLYNKNGTKLLDENFIIKPVGFTISSESSEIHGITQEIAQKKGKNITDVLQKFNENVKKAHTLVAHNMDFDAKILGAEYLRNDIPDVIREKDKICTMKKTVNFCSIQGEYGYKWPTLSELYQKLFESNFEEAHNAAVDTKATAECFWELKRIGKI